jgi:HEPN domain-containing protein
MAQKAMEIKLYRQVCFHSQQCAEKGLKAVILEKGKKLKKVHDLLELSKDIEELPLQLPASVEELDFLNRVYRSRYPPDIGLLPHGEPTKEDAQKALEVAERVFAQVEKLLEGKE